MIAEVTLRSDAGPVLPRVTVKNKFVFCGLITADYRRVAAGVGSGVDAAGAIIERVRTVAIAGPGSGQHAAGHREQVGDGDAVTAGNIGDGAAAVDEQGCHVGGIAEDVFRIQGQCAAAIDRDGWRGVELASLPLLVPSWSVPWLIVVMPL